MNAEQEKLEKVREVARAAVLRATAMSEEQEAAWRLAMIRAERRRKQPTPVDGERRRRVTRIWPGCPGWEHEDFYQEIAGREP